MKYLIGDILANEVIQSGKPFRVYAIERDMGESEFSQIRSGKRTASGKKLNTLINLEVLKDPLTNELKELIDTLDLDLLIDLYNLIYTKNELNKQ